jgi:inorganic pyrophosphatase
MSLQHVPSGRDIPEDIYVIVEIPAHSDPIKYEVDKNSGAVFVDRFIATPMFYPCNYGYINGTLAEDGDPLDVLVPTPYPLQIGSVIRCRPVALFCMEDDSGQDAKVIALPHPTLTSAYDGIRDVEALPVLLKGQIQHFFEHYKALEPGKWVTIKGWRDHQAAQDEIRAAVLRAQGE